MKILQFNLIAFGPFTNQTLDWSQGDHGLHVIYGENEAGKSSALRALRQLLFGIDQQTSDDFVHQYAKLRLGGNLRSRDGSELEFVRRKTPVKQPLFDKDDRQKIDPDALVPFLGNMNEDQFKTMFGIDHKELRRGGDEILAGKGDLGEMLFAAGSGIADLRKVQQRLQEDKENLFKPAGRNQKIAITLNDLSNKRDFIKNAYLPSETFLRKERELNEARSQRDRLEAKFKEASQQLKLSENIAAAHAFVQQRQNLLRELEEYRDVPSLEDSFSERRSRAQIQMAETGSRMQQAEKKIAELDEQLAHLQVPTEFLEQAISIEELYQRIGAYQESEKDFPERNTQRKTLEHEAKEILRSLGRPGDLDVAEELRLRADEPSHIQELSKTFHSLAAKLEKVSEDLEAAEQDLAQAESQSKNQKPLPDVASLRQLVRTVEKKDLPARLNSIRDELRGLQEQGDAALKQLPLWDGALSDLATLPAPTPETLERFEREFAEINDERKDLRRQWNEASTRLEEVQSEQQALKLQHDVPSFDELETARQRRDSLWQKIRQDWDKKEHPTANQIHDFDKSVSFADDVVDRLRREAGRVEKMAQLAAEADRLQKRGELLEEQISKADARFSDVDKRWQALWSRLTPSPLPPREMRAWLHRRDDLLKFAEQCRTLKSQQDALHDEISKSESQLRDTLRQLGETVAEDAPLDLLVAQAQAALENWDRDNQARQQAGRDLTRLQQRYKNEQRRKQQLEKALSDWRTQWQPAMAKLHLGPDATPQAAQHFVDSINKLFTKLHDADGYRRRLDGMKRDMELYRADVFSLAERLLDGVREEKPDRLAQALAARLQQARIVQKQHESLMQQRKKTLSEYQQSRSEHEKIQSVLDAMCKQARVASVEELPDAERRAQQRRSLDERLRELEENLLALQGGRTLEEFATEVMAHDPISLEMDMQGRRRGLEEIEKQLNVERDRVVELQLRFDDMDGRADAAEAENEAQLLAAQLRNDAEQFITLSLADEILKRGITRFRDKHHGEFVQRAGELFAKLTGDSFSGLIADYNEKGEPVLMGSRGNGDDRVDVDGMSSGTRDQLYLALRIAGLESYFQHHEPMPLILDDVLLNFDDHRATAALDALGELSTKTQVLFFTHHRHLVDLAKQSLSDDVLFVHELHCRSAAVM